MDDVTCSRISQRGERGGVPGRLSYDSGSDLWTFEPLRRLFRMTGLPDSWRGEPTLDTLSWGNPHIVFGPSTAFRFGPNNGRRARKLVEEWRSNHR